MGEKDLDVGVCTTYSCYSLSFFVSLCLPATSLLILMVELQKDERLIDMFSTHWIKYAAPVFVYLLLMSASILLFYFSVLSAHHNMWLSHITFLIALIIMLGIHHWFFHRIMSDSLIDIIITTRRFIFFEDRLWFRGDLYEVALEHLRIVEAQKHGILQNVLHYGSLWLSPGAGSSSIGKVIPRVPHPQRKAKEMTELLRMK